MKLRPLTATLLCVLIAVLVGATLAADFLWRAAIGLDPTGFPAGEGMQWLGELLFPGLNIALAGLALSLGSILLVAIGAFVFVRRQRRVVLGNADPSRRNFLSGSLAGAGAAVAALVAGGGTMVARSFYGVGHKHGRGWQRPLTEIFGGDVQKTHPEWKSNEMDLLLFNGYWRGCYNP